MTTQNRDSQLASTAEQETKVLSLPEAFVEFATATELSTRLQAALEAAFNDHTTKEFARDTALAAREEADFVWCDTQMAERKIKQWEAEYDAGVQTLKDAVAELGAAVVAHDEVKAKDAILRARAAKAAYEHVQSVAVTEGTRIAQLLKLDWTPSPFHIGLLVREASDRRQEACKVAGAAKAAERAAYEAYEQVRSSASDGRVRLIEAQSALEDAALNPSNTLDHLAA